ncbi:MAG: glycosyltransferase family 2 protein, partial [Candidatus Staskawiczbacteria bacterium]|nr:glycosyltransferase family 2 protein [Candidatus Staskawiczbacteria bacterium]
DIGIESVGALVNTEIIVKARKKGFRIVQVGVNHYPRFFGAQTGANPLVVIRAFKEIIKLWKKLR